MIHAVHPMTNQVDGGSLPSNYLGQTSLQSFLDSHLWIVEEELRTCIGRPLWFDSALCAVLVEVISDFANHESSKKCDTHSPRAKAREVCVSFERGLAVHSKHGIIKFANDPTFEALVCSVLQRNRALYWEALRFSKSLSSQCGPLGDTD